MTSTGRIVRRVAAFLALALAASLSLVASAPAMAAGISGALTVEIQESVDPSHNLALKHVELWSTLGGLLESGDTDLNGVFAFSTVLDGLEDYQILVAPGSPYVDVALDNKVAVTANSMVINLVPVAGTMFGTIANWNSTLVDPLLSGTGGTQIELWRYDVIDDQWEFVADGGDYIYNDWYRIAGVYDTEDYVVVVHPYFAADFYPTASDGSPRSSFGPFYASGPAGDPAGAVNLGSMNLLQAGYITGTINARDASFPPSYLYVVSDFPDLINPAVVEITFTEPDGDFIARVPAGGDYLVIALDQNGDYYQLSWDDHLFSFCPCGFDYEPVTVGAQGVVTPNIDFTLTPRDTSVMFDLYLSELDLSSLPDELDLEDVRVHLYKPVTGGWQEVDSQTSSMRGAAYVAGTSSGTYRLRFSVGTDWLPFTRYTDDNGTDTTVTACYLDVTGTSLGDDLLYDFLIDTQTSSPACAAEATPPSGSGTTSHSSGHTRTRVTDEPVFEVPSPTATPTPSPTPTETATPDDTSTPTPAPVPAAPAFTWLIWLFAILGVLIVCSVGFFIIRRR